MRRKTYVRAHRAPLEQELISVSAVCIKKAGHQTKIELRIPRKIFQSRSSDENRTPHSPKDFPNERFCTLHLDILSSLPKYILFAEQTGNVTTLIGETKGFLPPVREKSAQGILKFPSCSTPVWPK
eukprot:g78219.t1